MKKYVFLSIKSLDDRKIAEKQKQKKNKLVERLMLHISHTHTRTHAHAYQINKILITSKEQNTQANPSITVPQIQCVGGKRKVESENPPKNYITDTFSALKYKSIN